MKAIIRGKRRFEAKFIPEPNSGCWLWEAGIVGVGYGAFQCKEAGGLSHRAAWLLYRGPIPDGAHVCHHCDVRICVNPDHLFLGDNAANVADRVRKGRTVSVPGPERHNWIDGRSRFRGTIGKVRGPRHHNAKLTPELVRAIRSSPKQILELAAELGLAPSTVGRAKRRQSWTHVED